MKQASENATWSWSEIWSMILKRQFNIGFWQRCEEIIQTKYETCDLGFWQRCGEWGSSSGESRSFCAKANSTCQAPKINQDCFMKTRTNKKYYKTKYNENDKLRSLSKTKTKPKIKTNQRLEYLCQYVSARIPSHRVYRHRMLKYWKCEVLMISIAGFWIQSNGRQTQQRAQLLSTSSPLKTELCQMREGVGKQNRHFEGELMKNTPPPPPCLLSTEGWNRICMGGGFPLFLMSAHIFKYHNMLWWHRLLDLSIKGLKI